MSEVASRSTESGPPHPRPPDLMTSAVVREALGSIVREMRRAMVRSSYSSIIYEGYDFSCVLIDGQGRLIAESGEDHPFHIIPVANAVAGALALHEQIGPDDIFLHNDPYTGGTHLNDVAVIWPVFDADRPALPAFFVVVRSHWGDVGGMTPGSLNGAAVDILQEGLRLNYLKVDRQGKSEAMRLIFDNVRATHEALSDFQSVLGICRVAEGRLRKMVRRYGLGLLEACIDDILDASERRLRAAICRLPNGTYRHRAYLDGNASTVHPLVVELALTIENGSVHADFDGSSDQVQAPLNAGPAIAPTSVLTVLKSFVDPRGSINSGTLRVLRVTAPAGSIVNARSPAPCGGLNEVRFACDAAVMGALGRVIPLRMTGDVRGTSNHTYIGGRGYIFYEYPSGGTGAWSDGDGNHAVRAFNEGENVSIQSTEVVEATYPLRILRHELRPDSGGVGQFRGGCGLIREVEIRGEGAQFSLLSDRNIVAPAGVNGGGSGAQNRYGVRRAGRMLNVSDFPGKVAGFALQVADVVVMQSSGGGGWGSPSLRNPGALADDLADGIVTEKTLRDYQAEPLRAAGVAHHADLPKHGCRLAAALAGSLGARAGSLIELLAPVGPAHRFWVLDIDESPDANAISVGLPMGPESVVIRLLAESTPLSPKSDRGPMS